MKILAPFDQTERSQATIPLLHRLARLSAEDVEVTLLSVAHAPEGTRAEESIRPVVVPAVLDRTLPVALPAIEPPYAELKIQAVERVLNELHDYLGHVAARLPEGIRIDTEAHLADDPAKTIIECAQRRGVDVIVMATQSGHGIARALLGETADNVVESGVAPVLLIAPKDELPRDVTTPDEERPRLPATGVK